MKTKEYLNDGHFGIRSMAGVALTLLVFTLAQFILETDNPSGRTWARIF